MSDKEKQIYKESNNSLEAWKRLSHEIGGLWDVSMVERRFEIIKLGEK